jgi:GntR family transcriptional regulator
MEKFNLNQQPILGMMGLIIKRGACNLTNNLPDPNSPIPLYHQLKEILKEGITSGKWSAGELVPSEHLLQSEYKVSRNTVQKAINELVQEGFLLRKQGKGTFAATPKLEQSLTGFYSFSEAMLSRGITPRVSIISLAESPATDTAARFLQIASGEMLTTLTRVRYADQEPIMVETSYVPVSVAPGLLSKNLGESALYSVLSNDYGVFVKKAKEMFEPVLIREWESKWLEVKIGYPALLLDRIAYDTTGKPVEFCRSIVRGDRCRFYTELL